jgi:hypothetical protein
MTPQTEFRSGVIAPVECVKEGWAMIKDRYWLFLGITLVGMLVGGAVPVVLVGAMTCGIYICLFAQMRGEPFEFGTLFKGFDYFMPALVAAAIQTVPVLLIVGVGQVFVAAFTMIVLPTQRGDAPPLIFWLGLIVYVVVIIAIALVIHSLFLFAYPLVVDRKLSGMEAIKLSYRAVLQNLSGVVGLILLLCGLGLLGLLACYIGAFFLMPVSFASYAVAYRRVFPDTGPYDAASPPPPPGNWAA